VSVEPRDKSCPNDLSQGPTSQHYMGRSLVPIRPTKIHLGDLLVGSRILGRDNSYPYIRGCPNREPGSQFSGSLLKQKYCGAA
jgi:hypothetical protein